MAAHVSDDDGRAGRIRGSVSRLIAALLLVWLAERFVDLGVIVALALATLFLFTRDEWLAVILPLAGWLAADPQWRTTTIALYAVFAAIALFRKNFFAAGAAIVVAAVEFFRGLT